MEQDLPHLTKSRFVAGLQCHDLLWWKVHEPTAEELVPDVALEDRFEQGREVGVAARRRFPEGVLVPTLGGSVEERVEATRKALTGGAEVIHEASFLCDRVFVSVDILKRVNGSFRLIEVKSSTKVKEKHIPDVAIQRYVLDRCGLGVSRTEIMHLDSACRYPDLGNLFSITDVSEEVEELLPRIPVEIEAQLAVIDGPFPEGGFGRHCLSAKDCPFHDRCWPEETSDSVLTLHRVHRDKKGDLWDEGIRSIHDLGTRRRELNKVAQRQVRSIEAGARIWGKRLAEALRASVPSEGRLAYLDFETVRKAIPVWKGCGPWAQMPVQFSCHKERKPGWPEHFEFLAQSGEDCREALAEALIEACDGASGIVVYNASFERGCIRGLAEAVPRLASALEEIDAKLVDLLPLVRDYVYDPGFLGSFSLKTVLPALLPDLDYDDLAIADGDTASAYLSRLLFHPEVIPAQDRESLRATLRAYCERDTWATVRLLEKLRELGQEAERRT